MTRVGSALAVALVASGCLQQPVSSHSGAVSQGPAWDDSTTLDVGGQQLVVTGPVLHRSVDSTSGALQVVSRRCYLIALGVGFLVELDANERAWHDGAPGLESLWQPSQLAPSQPCQRAFGAGFRLPTGREADAWLARNNDVGPIFSQDAGSLGSVRREIRRCEMGEDCRASRSVNGPPQAATLRCVGPLSALPSAVPSEPEVRSCVAAFGGVGPTPSESGKLAPLDPGALDVVLAARRACVSGGAAYQQLHDALRRHVGSKTVVALAREASADERVTALALATLHAVLGRFSEPSPVDCETAPAWYQRVCNHPLARDCLLLQARFAQQCRQTDVASQLASAARDWDAQALSATARQRQAATLVRASVAAVRCSERDPAAVNVRQALHDVLGAQPVPPAGSRPICPCPVEDLACGLAALRTGGLCPENRASN